MTPPPLTTASFAKAATILLSISLLAESDNRVAAEDGQKAAPAPDAALTKRVLGTLPANTESVIVMGPWKYRPVSFPKPIGYRNGLPIYAPDASATKISVQSEAYRCNTGLFELQPQLLEHCRTREIELSVFAFRTVRTTASIPNATAFESCQILISKGDSAQSVRDVFESATVNVAGLRIVAVADELKLVVPTGVQPPRRTPAPSGGKAADAKLAVRHAYFAMPSSRTLIAATSETLLKEVLQSVAQANPPDNGFPTPEHLPVAQVCLWGLRRFGPEFGAANQPRVIPMDSNARRLLITYEQQNDQIRVRLTSPDPQSDETLRTMISQLMEQRTKVERVDKDTVQMLMSAVDGGAWFGVIAMLGIRVFL